MRKKGNYFCPCWWKTNQCIITNKACLCRKKKIEKGSVALKKHTSETEKLKKVIDFTLETCWKKQKNRQNSYQHIKNRNKKIIHPPKDTCLLFFKRDHIWSFWEVHDRTYSSQNPNFYLLEQAPGIIKLPLLSNLHC